MSTSPSRVLIVEDQRLVAADLEETLVRLGYEVVGSVASGEEAIPRALETRPDLMLLDIRLRGELDGIQTATAILERLDLPIIYLTAYADEETVRRARVTGPSSYLVKPFNERELRAAIDIALYKHANDRILAEERARRVVAEEYKALVEGVEDYAIFLLDLSGRVTTWNVGAERINGYAAAEIIGRHSSVLYTPEDAGAGRFEATLKAAIARGRTEDEGWRVRKDGSRFWANVITSALRDERGEVRGFAKITRDMTARRAAELALQESEARTRAMINGALDAVVSVGADGRALEWNPAAEETFGYAREEVIGRDLTDLLIPERLRPRYRARLSRWLRAGAGRFIGRRLELPALTRERGEIIVELSVVRSTAGSSPSFTGFLRDITARKAAEAERARKAEAEHLLDQATVALASSLEVSETLPKAARLVVPDLADFCLIDLANEAGELIQAAAAHLDPQKEALARRLGRERNAEGRALPQGAHHVFRTGRPELHPGLEDLAWAAEPLGDDHPGLLRDLGVLSHLIVPIRIRGRTQGVLSLLRGPPARRFGAEDLWLAEELARRIGLAVDNARLFRDAQAAIRARDEFLQVASHELKTPLTPLLLQLDTLTRALARSGLQSEHFAAKLEVATRQTVRLGRLVESLLDISRITAGHLGLTLERLDLAELVRDVVERFQLEARSAGSELKISTEGPAFGCWDRLRLEQVLSNLVSNAIKYGSGSPIEIDLTQNEDAVRLTVTDRGIGIEAGAQDRIFERFERGVPVRNYGGLGLGLFIARQFAEAHGGALVVQSQLGQGSTFTLVLPRDPVASRAAHAPGAEG